MPATIPSPSKARDLLLVLAVAAAITGGSAIASGLNAIGEVAPAATRTAGGEAPGRPVASPFRAAVGCECSGEGEVQTGVPATGELLLIPRSAALPGPSLARMRAPQTGSYAAWKWADTDPRHITSSRAWPRFRDTPPAQTRPSRTAAAHHVKSGDRTRGWEARSAMPKTCHSEPAGEESRSSRTEAAHGRDASFVSMTRVGHGAHGQA